MKVRGLKQILAIHLIVLSSIGLNQASAVEILAIKDAAIPAAASKTQVYIVQVRGNPAVAYEGDISGFQATKPAPGKKIDTSNAQIKKYVSYLDGIHDQILLSIGAANKIYSYHYALNGFAAVLSSSQVAALNRRDDVVQVWRDEIRQPTTNSTPDYLALTGPGGVWETSGKGEDVIIGIVDTGIWPEHESFSDQNDFSPTTGESGKRNLAYGPAPADWSGSCRSGERWSQDNCNNKLIGANWYVDGFSAHGGSGILTSDFLSARDSDGHGSHTASTAAGNEGPINTINGEPVSGIAPRARLAVYKVCWEPRSGNGGCASSDSAAAIDQAVADGVDVINFSIGGDSTVFAGADDIAFLFAASAGVYVATSNGNEGPGAATTGTPAGVPWITAVGATQDNEAFALNLRVTTPPAIAADYFGREGASDIQFSDTGDIAGSLVPAIPHNGCGALTNPADISGNIALVIRGVCAFTTKYNNAAAAGATAIVVYNDGASADRLDPIVMSAPGTTLPGLMIGFADGDLINSTAGVFAHAGPGTQVSQNNRIADFSSRGPNAGAADIIKPDVAAPGVSIIAAETLEPNANANGGVPYQRISGTSMASPHVAGVFALLKESHPGWSAAAAKSALMTSARQNLKKTLGTDAADPFDIGAGHIVPAGAFAPGLIYDAGFYDYLAFSCDNNVQLVSNGSCALLQSWGFPVDGSDLNLASIGIAEFLGSQTVTRKVTSVTPGTTHFTSVVQAPAGIDVSITPSSFDLAENASQTVAITFTANANVVAEDWTFGALTWENDAGASDARSPIAIRPIQLAADAEVDISGTSGSVNISVEFGYTGVYSAGLSGLAEAMAISNNIDAVTGLHVYCGDFPALDHLRLATFDVDTTTPGSDDIDLRLFSVTDCATFGNLTQIGGSGGVTSEETIDVAHPGAGGYVFVIDYYQAATGTSIDYTAFISLVSGDEGNATITVAPASATAGSTDTVTVNYGGLIAGKRYLGVVSHEDAGGEIARTIVDVSTQ